MPPIRGMNSVEEIKTSEERYFQPAEDAIMRVLSDHFSRMIILSTTERPKSVEDVSRENNIPLSTCYRRVGILSRQGILIVERVIITPTGKKHVLYRTTLKGIHADLSLGHLTVSVEPNEDICD